MGAHPIASFEYWIDAARWNLTELQRYRGAVARGSCLRMAEHNMQQALNAASRARCRARKALCLRVLNWIRADLRRAA